jgi:hypothetical protein
VDAGRLDTYRGNTSPVRMIVARSYAYDGWRNSDYSRFNLSPVPDSIDAVRALVDARNEKDRRVRDEARQRDKLMRNGGIPAGATHVIDASGFRALTDEERGLNTPREDLEKRWFGNTDWSKVTLKL